MTMGGIPAKWLALMAVGALIVIVAGQVLQSGVVVVGEVEVLSVEPSSFPPSGGSATLRFRARIYDYWSQFAGDYKISAGVQGKGSLASINLGTSWREGTFSITVEGQMEAGKNYPISAYGGKIGLTYAQLQCVKTFMITCGSPSPTHTLTIMVYPANYGTTTPLPRAYTHNHGDTVSVTATAFTGYKFAYWSGSYTSKTDSTCLVTLDADKTITARFVTDIGQWEGPEWEGEETPSTVGGGGEGEGVPPEPWIDWIQRNWLYLLILILLVMLFVFVK